MVEVNVKDARSKLSELLNRVEKGEEIIIKRRGKRIARMVPSRAESRLPSLRDFRASLKVRGKPLSQMVIDARKEERY
ncbi:MAG: type II toxin-antitoxin system prevent-host-death family antitoxin [Deltaproteobacteria bacterium]|nr:MAG: type II toxin-antitoxin system prevent-host-death family antitoxin [Deltaproteobacteria bacterium]